MSYTVSLQQRLQQLKKAQADLPNIMYKVQKDATLRAIEAAADATPPKAGTGRLAGQNMLSGELKAHWATDSEAEPKEAEGGYQTVLANDLEYASYVNDGHRLDRHFVPGLYIDENGQLVKDLSRPVGIVVGTKTKYVKGEFMVDKAKEAYEKTVLSELDKNIQEALK
ncbi:MAG: HK97 gp10 family phage protein [Candidatus Metalachnospira sp.]|nr:HK97 gp10 family phage protein [Candidatus Metalachnospira sp.]